MFARQNEIQAYVSNPPDLAQPLGLFPCPALERNSPARGYVHPHNYNHFE